MLRERSGSTISVPGSFRVVRVSSEPGEGTTIRFTLPVVEDDRPRRAA